MTEPAALAPARIAALRAGEWSANECAGHLIEPERRGFAGRIRRILVADRPDIPADLEGWDPPAVAEARRDQRGTTSSCDSRTRCRWSRPA